MWTDENTPYDEGDACPWCGEPVEIIEHEFLPYEQPFNWNKK